MLGEFNHLYLRSHTPCRGQSHDLRQEEGFLVAVPGTLPMLLPKVSHRLQVQAGAQSSCQNAAEALGKQRKSGTGGPQGRGPCFWEPHIPVSPPPVGSIPTSLRYRSPWEGHVYSGMTNGVTVGTGADVNRMGRIGGGGGGGGRQQGARTMEGRWSGTHTHSATDSTIHIDLPYFQKQIDLGF